MENDNIVCRLDDLEEKVNYISFLMKKIKFLERKVKNLEKRLAKAEN